MSTLRASGAWVTTRNGQLTEGTPPSRSRWCSSMRSGECTDLFNSLLILEDWPPDRSGVAWWTSRTP